jgi:hypothetical protein
MNPALLLSALILVAPAPDRVLPSAPRVAVVQADPHETIVHAAIAAQAIGQFSDVATTMYAMGRGDFREGNPVLAWAEDKPAAMGLVKGALAAANTYGLLKLHASHPKLALVVALGLTALHGWVSWHNYTLIREGRR